MKFFSIVWYVISLLLIGAFDLTRNLFLQVDQKKTQNKLVYAWPIATIGHNTCPMAASSDFYQSPGPPPLGDARGIVPVHRCSHQNGQKSWSILLWSFCLLLPWQPLGQYKQVVAQWWHPVASGEPLDMPHWAMLSVLLWRTAVAIKTDGGWGTVTHCCLIFPWCYL